MQVRRDITGVGDGSLCRQQKLPRGPSLRDFRDKVSFERWRAGIEGGRHGLVGSDDVIGSD